MSLSYSFIFATTDHNERSKAWPNMMMILSTVSTGFMLLLFGMMAIKTI